MKYIREKSVEIIKDGKYCKIYIEEYATIYRVSAKFVGWALCFVEGLSFPKRSTTEQTIIDYILNLKH
jgi:hypothetical protein